MIAISKVFHDRSYPETVYNSTYLGITKLTNELIPIKERAEKVE